MPPNKATNPKSARYVPTAQRRNFGAVICHVMVLHAMHVCSAVPVKAGLVYFDPWMCWLHSQACIHMHLSLMMHMLGASKQLTACSEQTQMQINSRQLDMMWSCQKVLDDTYATTSIFAPC